MIKKLLLLFCLVTVLLSTKAQNLTGKILYSHFNEYVTLDPTADSIYAVSNNGLFQEFVTVGFRPRLSHHGKYMAFTNGPNPNDSYGANIWMRDLQAQKDTEIVQNSDYLDYYDFSPDDSVLFYSEE